MGISHQRLTYLRHPCALLSGASSEEEHMDSQRFNQQHREQQRQARERQERLRQEQQRREQERRIRQRREDDDRRRSRRRREELRQTTQANQQRVRAQRSRLVEATESVGRSFGALEAKLVLSITMTNGSKLAVKPPIGESVIGRSPSAHIRLPDDTVSAEHARIRWDGERSWIRDLSSTNGTTLRGRKLTEWTEVKAGDSIRLGTVEMSLSIEPSGPPADHDRTLVTNQGRIQPESRNDRRWGDSPVAIASLIVGLLGLGIGAVQLNPGLLGLEIGPIDVVREIIPEGFGGSGGQPSPGEEDVSLSPPSNLRIVGQEGCDVLLEWNSPNDTTGIVRYEVLVDGRTGGFTTNSAVSSTRITIFSGATRRIEVVSAGWGFNQSVPSNSQEASCESGFGPEG